MSDLDATGGVFAPQAARATNGAGARSSSFVLLAVATLAIGLDVGVARITYGVVLPSFTRELQLSLTAAGLLGTLHLIGYLLGTLASPSLNAKVGALRLCRASHLVFARAMLVCGLTSDITTMAASRFVAGLAAGFGVFSIFLVFIPRAASAARAQPKAAHVSPSRLAELTSVRWIFRDRHLSDPQQGERRGLSVLLYGRQPRAWVSASFADPRSAEFSPTGSVHRPSAGSPPRFTAQACLPRPPTAATRGLCRKAVEWRCRTVRAGRPDRRSAPERCGVLRRTLWTRG